MFTPSAATSLNNPLDRQPSSNQHPPLPKPKKDLPSQFLAVFKDPVPPKHNFNGTGISQLTAMLGSLRSLSSHKFQTLADHDFTLFTHKRREALNEPVLKSYKDLREACVELFLQIKIRDDDQIEAYNEDLYQLEKLDLKHHTGFELVEMVKETVQLLMSFNDLGYRHSSEQT